MTKTATQKRKDTEVFWCHLLFQEVNIGSTVQSKRAMDNRFLCKICLPYLSSEELAQKWSFCILHYLRLLWCSVTKRGLEKLYSRILLPTKTAQKMQKGVPELLLVSECFGSPGPHLCTGETPAELHQLTSTHFLQAERSLWASWESLHQEDTQCGQAEGQKLQPAMSCSSI